MRIDVLLYIFQDQRHDWLGCISETPEKFGLELVQTIKGRTNPKVVYKHKESGRFFGIKWAWHDIKPSTPPFMGEMYQEITYTTEKPFKHLCGGYNDLHCS